MKFSRTLAALTAAAMAVSSMAVIASAEEAAAVTDEQYFELIKTVKSVSATLTVNELAPETAGGFAAFYMQNNGGDWAWFASADEAESIKLDGAGEYEVVWSDVQSVISKTAGSLSLSLLKAPAETWESYPSFGIQVGSDGITAAGDEGKVDAKVTGVVITFTDDTTMELPEFAVAGDLLGKEEDWGLSGNNVMFNMAELIKAEMAKTPADDETGDDENTNDDETLGDSEEVPGDSEEVPGGDEDGDGNVDGDDEDETPGESSGEPTNPDTGVALVVVPAALAAAALATSGIALKKRSK